MAVGQRKMTKLWLCHQITIQRDSGLDVSAPKHGKIDANNAPHVGGNQWAGGTGHCCTFILLTLVFLIQWSDMEY